MARASYEHALQYSNERMTFGKPLHKHQAIQFMLADMKTKIEASRMLTWKSAFESDQGIRNTESAAHAKRFAADTMESPLMRYKYSVVMDTLRNTQLLDL